MKHLKKLLALSLVLGLTLTPVSHVFVVNQPAYVRAEAKTAQEIKTTILSVHPKYGNATIAIAPSEMHDKGYQIGDMIYLDINGHKLEMPFVTNFSDVDHGSLVLVESAKKDKPEEKELIAAINMGNFSKAYHAEGKELVEVGNEVTITLKEAGAYKEEYEIRHLVRTNDIADYNNDPVVFANFRAVPTSGLKPGILYRSSNPINNEIFRAKYADALVKEAGVKTVLNLADTAEQINEYAAKADFASPYYKGLFDNGSVKPLSMGVDVAAPEFGQKLAEGLKFLVGQPGPYLVHCTEGKDRAGFVSAVLSSLMGASLDEVVADYMTTYENYYHVEKGSTKYNKIAESNIKTSLKTVMAGLDKSADLTGIDLAAAATAYLQRIGLTDEEITKLKFALSANSGTVTAIEKYGHAMSDIKVEDLKKAGFAFGDMVTITFDNGFTLDAPFVDGYFVEKGAYLLRAYPGDETVAVCINYGKFNEKANVAVGNRFTVKLKEKGGFMDEYLKRHLIRTNERKDYASDAVFANFRNIRLGRTKENTLFRSSSPIDNKYKRAAFADRLLGEAGVRTIVDMADSKEKIEELLKAEDFHSPNFKKAYEEGRVLALNLGLAYESPEFKAGVIKGLQFMAANEGPYLFHCIEGKDRTGFMGALLNAFMGASLEEIGVDYMQSYENFYGVSKEKDAKQYALILEDVYGMLKYITGEMDLSKVNLKEKVTAYMLSGGMTEAEIAQLGKNLGESEVITPEPNDPAPELKITSGTTPVYVIGGEIPTIICNGDFDKLTAILFDGVRVADGDMKLEKGSTRLTFTKAFLDRQKPGTHKVTFVYGEDSVTVDLKIAAKSAQPKRQSPKTGDGSLHGAYLALMLLTVVVAPTAYGFKKKYHK